MFKMSLLDNIKDLVHWLKTWNIHFVLKQNTDKNDEYFISHSFLR